MLTAPSFLIKKHAAPLVCALVVLCLITSASWAQNNNAKQPIHIEADRMEYDTVNKISRFFGSVVAKQGSLVIRSAQMEVRQDASGNQLGVATGTAQRRAFFRQDRENTNEHVEGEALRLEYDSRTSTLKLVGNAIMRRYRGNQLWDQTTGNTITYNDVTSFFTVEGNSTTRVTAVMTPESKE